VRAPLLGPADLRDRLDRGRAAHVIADSAQVGKFASLTGDYTRVAVGAPVPGRLSKLITSAHASPAGA
jgi:acetyl-CoA synthetase